MTIDKGGHNSDVSQVKDRPESPAPMTGNGGGKLAEAVHAATEEAAQKAAQQAALREAQMRAIYAQRREALAGIILNGMCSGYYGNLGEITPGFGERLVEEAVQFADKLLLRLSKPPAANDA